MARASRLGLADGRARGRDRRLSHGHQALVRHLDAGRRLLAALCAGGHSRNHGGAQRASLSADGRDAAHRNAPHGRHAERGVPSSHRGRLRTAHARYARPADVEDHERRELHPAGGHGVPQHGDPRRALGRRARCSDALSRLGDHARRARGVPACLYADRGDCAADPPYGDTRAARARRHDLAACGAPGRDPPHQDIPARELCVGPGECQLRERVPAAHEARLQQGPARVGARGAGRRGGGRRDLDRLLAHRRRRFHGRRFHGLHDRAAHGGAAAQSGRQPDGARAGGHGGGRKPLRHPRREADHRRPARRDGAHCDEGQPRIR